MKRLIVLVLVFGSLTTYIYINKTDLFGEEIVEGDPPAGATPVDQQVPLIGKEIEEDKVTDIKTLVQMQTDFAMYINGKMHFDEMTERNMKHLEKVYEYPYKPEKGWLFSSGYEEFSEVKVFYQSSLDETRTVIYKTRYRDKGQVVEKIYDGDFFKLVAVDVKNVKRVIGYDKDHEEHYVEVGE